MTRINEDLVNRIADLPPQGLRELLDFLEPGAEDASPDRTPELRSDQRDGRETRR